MRIITNRKGSWILEAAISLPIFFIAVITMCSIILMYACIEDCNFIVGTELRRGAAEAIYANTSPAIPLRIIKRMKENHTQIKRTYIKSYRYRASMIGQDELIGIKINVSLETKNPLGIASNADYDIAFVTRAYVGKIRETDKMNEEEMMSNESTSVYVFPKRGEKYHNRDCRFLKAASTSTVLSGKLKRKYKNCPLCKSGKASIGSRVYYFPAEGEAFHLANCSSLQKNYIEIDKKTAVKRGYTACQICGG
ncbi:MAG TPA: hypothetical protein GX736_06680 [Mogibacterium sp.]|nr:hypothetical protein [Mogibacterium sp.]